MQIHRKITKTVEKNVNGKEADRFGRWGGVLNQTEKRQNKRIRKEDILVESGIKMFLDKLCLIKK